MFEAGVEGNFSVVRRRVVRIFINSNAQILTETLITLSGKHHVVDITSAELMNPPN